MKKLQSKINLNNSAEIKLTQKELDQLRGGDDTYNTNSIMSCSCTYKNKSVTINQNSELGGKCTCM